MLDLIARKVIMSAVLYYGADAPVLSDGDYDHMIEELGSRWDELHPFRQWQFGDVGTFRSTGMDYKITIAAANGATSWLEAETGIRIRLLCNSLKTTEAPGVPPIRWCPAGLWQSEER
jgi:hypothetical protein